MPTAHQPKQVEKGKRQAKTLCSICDNEESLVDSLGQPMLPPELRKLAPKEIGKPKLPPKSRKLAPKEIGQPKLLPELRKSPLEETGLLKLPTKLSKSPPKELSQHT
jgi:hypothetical protein